MGNVLWKSKTSLLCAQAPLWHEAREEIKLQAFLTLALLEVYG
jgi:hypothetical protein